jgi:hypothetical protein
MSGTGHKTPNKILRARSRKRFERGWLDMLPIAKEMGLRDAHSRVFWVLLRCNDFGEPQPSFPILFWQLFLFDAVPQPSEKRQPDDFRLPHKEENENAPCLPLDYAPSRCASGPFIHTHSYRSRTHNTTGQIGNLFKKAHP